MSPSTVCLLYVVLSAGAVGIYFALPRRGPSKAAVGAVFGLSGVAGLIALMVTRSASPDSRLFFYLFATVAVLAAARVITHPKPVYSAIYFVLVVVAVAAILVLQEAEFLAVASVLICAGAILVTYLFVIMLAQEGGATVYDRRAREPFLSVLAGFVLMGAIAGKAGSLPEQPDVAVTPITSAQPSDSLASLPVGNTAAIGAAVMTRYVVALEVGGLLLLIAMIGAIALSKKKVPAEGPSAAPRVLGQVGKEVEPF